MKNYLKFILAVIIAAGLPTLVSTTAYGVEGYLMDSEDSIVKNDYGGCWHTGYWTLSMAVEGCDPVAQHEEKPQPKAEAIIPPPRPGPLLKALPQKVTLTEEDMFNFDKAELKTRGKEKLDSMMNDLEGAKYGVIHVIGYTDRIGSKEYNHRLSLRRAEAVKDYLIQKGIPADLIDAEGRGEADPITKPTDCREMSSEREIACLQPDRRVEVMVKEAK
jgi:OOP family OmpA-OmpF porin